MAESRLERVAAAIADGRSVDWELELGAAAPAERRLLQQLRVVAEIAASAPGPGPGPGDRWGPLQVVAPIGSGAFADVFRARDVRLGRDVALKLLREADAGSEVVAEGRTLAQVRHPSVVTVHGADRVDGRTGLWMELVSGRTLEQLLRAEGRFDAKTAAQIGTALCAALGAVHAAGLVHRDVKAQNVMREPGGRVVLMDFGVGRPLLGPASAPAGTPLYMAPEVLAGDPPTPRSDLYSLGVLLYHLVTDDYPFRADSVEALRQAHARGERRPLCEARPDLPDAFARAVESALETDPLRRPADAAGLRQSLLAAISPRRRRGLTWGLAGVAVLLLLLIPWPHDHPQRESPPVPQSSAAPPGPAPAPAATVAATARQRRPASDPFVAPLGGATERTEAPPSADAAYSIDARRDAVELRVRPSAAVSLYIFSIDESGRPSLVFPARGRLADNPLAPARETRVPLWGRRLVAVATPVRFADFEAEIARQRVPVADLQSVPVSDAALERLAAALAYTPGTTGRLLAGAPPLAGHVELLRGLWVRRLDP